MPHQRLFLVLSLLGAAAKAQNCSPPYVLPEPELVHTQGSQPVTLTAKVTVGTPPLNFQWYLGPADSTANPLGTTQSITVSPSSQTNYWVRVTSSCGSVDSPAALVIPSNCAFPPPDAVIQGVPPIVCADSRTLNASMAPDSDPAATYDWNVSSAIGPSMILDFMNGGRTITWKTAVGESSITHQRGAVAMRATITNSCGSRSMELKYVYGDKPPQPVITAPSTVAIGHSYAASVNRPETYALPQPFMEDEVYTWSITNGTFTSGQGTPTITFTPGPGHVTLEVTVSNACSTAHASHSMQSCGGPPHISGPDDVMVTAGEPFTLNVSTSGDEPTTIDWFEGALGSTDHPMGSGSQLTAVRTSTTFFWARASNSCGSSNSRLTAVTVVQCLSPSIMQEPKNVAVQQGQSATIGFQTSGAPASVQWYRGSQGDTSNPVPEATSTTLTIDHVTASASYWAQVSNGCGSASTRAAMVSMIPARHRSAGH